MEKNPIIYLTRKLWKYSKGNRGSVILYFVMFVFANMINFLEPLVIAKLLNVIQLNGITNSSMHTLLFYLGILFLINMGFWAFHGPARLIENRNAFLARANYKKYLLDGVMAFPIEWHNNHHSGNTIDKVEKGTTALFNFSSETFEIIEFIIRLVSSYLALVYFNLYAGYIVLFMVTITLLLIIQFDKVLIGQYKTLYGKENKITQKVFDVISNITT
ncbi:MAG: ABC transporter transmembrane domain-containing protein, partial [Patescibacteria group bacterium]|nr:ABC transporter transmembrane domain-containing protein [Patescibacteria group bacterium]